MQFSTIEMAIRKEAESKGAYQSKCEIAKALKKTNLPIEEIAKATGLSKEKILKL